MSTITRQPTANTTPDAAQGGTAVTGASNTGHGSTSVTHTNAPGTTIKSCVWTTFAAVSGQAASITLSFSYSEDGTISGDGANNFRVQYSIDGGSSWTNALSHSTVTASDSNTIQVVLSATQDVTLVQARSRLQCSGNGIGNGATITAAVSSILITVETQAQSQTLVMM